MQPLLLSAFNRYCLISIIIESIIKNNNHMYNQADACNARVIDTLKELFDVFFLIWAPYMMIHLNYFC